MNRLPLEVADIIRSAGEPFRERSRRWITWQHHKVLDAILHCRTAVLGGHRDRCADCGHVAISYNSCGNRHCPRCQGNARLRWLRAREPMLAVSDLWRSHAHGRTDLCRRTPAPCSTADCQVCCMTGLIKTRSVGILRDEQPMSASCPDPPCTSLEVAPGRRSATRFRKPHAPTGLTQASITACAHRTSSRGPFKIHKCLRTGAASFKSLYLKRPPGSQVTDASPRGHSRYSPKTYRD